MTRLTDGFSRKEKFFLGIVTLLLAARFYGLTFSPPGWYTDETNILNTICLRHTSGDVFGDGWFSLHRFAISGEFSYFAPAYTIPSAAWLTIFGETLWSIRALEVAFSLVTVAAIGGIANNFLGRKGMLWALGLASIDPWSWALSRIAFGPSTTQSLSYMMVGTWILTRGGWKRPLTRAECIVGGIFLGTAFTAHHTLIASAIITATLMIGLILFGQWNKHALWIPSVAGAVLAVYLGSFPSGQGPFSSTSRSGQVSILDEAYRKSRGLTSNLDLLREFISNLQTHLSPSFLFTHGDANLRHHSGMGGELSWVLIFLLVLSPLVVVHLRANPRSHISRLFFLSAAGMLGGLTSASLTYESIPHANRSLPAAPFFILLGTSVAFYVSERFDLLPMLCVGLGVLFVNWYGTDYYREFPSRAANAFSAPVRQAGEAAIKAKDFQTFYSQIPQFRMSYDLIPRSDFFWEALGTGQKCPGAHP